MAASQKDHWGIRRMCCINKLRISNSIHSISSAIKEKFATVAQEQCCLDRIECNMRMDGPVESY